MASQSDTDPAARGGAGVRPQRIDCPRCGGSGWDECGRCDGASSGCLYCGSRRAQQCPACSRGELEAPRYCAGDDCSERDEVGVIVGVYWLFHDVLTETDLDRLFERGLLTLEQCVAEPCDHCRAEQGAS